MLYRKAINETIETIRREVNKDWTGSTVSINNVLSIDHLASEACMSKTNFKRFFKAIVDTHETVHQYITRLRVQRVMKLLKEKKYDFSTISAMVGFSNVPALNALVRKAKDTTPGELQAALGEKNNVKYPFKIDNPKKIKSNGLVLLGILSETGYDQPDEKWDKLYEYASKRDILLPNTQEYFGITYDDSDVADPDRTMFCSCMSVKDFVEDKDTEFKRLTIQEGEYAVFTHHGGYELLDSFYDSILTMLPEDSFRDEPIIEKYTVWDVKDERDLVTEVAVPIYGV